MGVSEHNRASALPRRSLTWLGWLCAALLLALFVWRTALPASQQKSYAFSVYYTAARLALAGQAGARLCDDAWLFEQQRGLGFGDRADYFCPNPPTNALALVPVAWLPPPAAQAAWIACDLAMLGAIVAVAWRLVTQVDENLTQRRKERKDHQPSHSWRLGGFARLFGDQLPDRSQGLSFALVVALALVLFRPLHAELHAVQVYTLLALLYTLWLYGYLVRRDWLCGAALALLVLLKFSGWPLWLLMLAAGRWRALACAIGIGAAAGLATLPLLGLAFWRLYLLVQAPAIDANPTHAAPANQTLTSLLRQLFSYDPVWSPRPLLDAPWLARLVWWLAVGLLIAITLILAYRRAQSVKGSQSAGSDPIALAGLCLVVPLQPAGEEYHYTLLLVVLLLLFSPAGPLRLRSRAAAAGAALAVVLFALPSYFLDTARWQGWPAALLAYPRLYGALGLWAILMFRRDMGLAVSLAAGGEHG